jgi:hypothetical protein
VRDRLRELERRRAALAGQERPSKAKVRRLVPEAQILREVALARDNLAEDPKGDDPGAFRTREDLRSAIAQIRSGPIESRKVLEIDGNIKGILRLAGCPDDSKYRWLRE